MRLSRSHSPVVAPFPQGYHAVASRCCQPGLKHQFKYSSGGVILVQCRQRHKILCLLIGPVPGGLIHIILYRYLRSNGSGLALCCTNCPYPRAVNPASQSRQPRPAVAGMPEIVVMDLDNPRHAYTVSPRWRVPGQATRAATMRGLRPVTITRCPVSPSKMRADFPADSVPRLLPGAPDAPVGSPAFCSSQCLGAKVIRAEDSSASIAAAHHLPASLALRFSGECRGLTRRPARDLWPHSLVFQRNTTSPAAAQLSHAASRGRLPINRHVSWRGFAHTSPVPGLLAIAAVTAIAGQSLSHPSQ